MCVTSGLTVGLVGPTHWLERPSTNKLDRLVEQMRTSAVRSSWTIYSVHFFLLFSYKYFVDGYAVFLAYYYSMASALRILLCCHKYEYEMPTFKKNHAHLYGRGCRFNLCSSNNSCRHVGTQLTAVCCVVLVLKDRACGALFISM